MNPAKVKRLIAEHERRREWSAALDLCGNQLRMRKLMRWWAAGRLTPAELREVLPMAWIQLHAPRQFPERALVALFRAAGYIGEEPAPAVPMVVFRGATSARKRAMSWTRSQERATWFARRLNNKMGRVYGAILDAQSGISPSTGVQQRGRVYRATVSSEGVLMVTNERGEDEVVVDPRSLRGLQVGGSTVSSPRSAV